MNDRAQLTGGPYIPAVTLTVVLLVVIVSEKVAEKAGPMSKVDLCNGVFGCGTGPWWSHSLVGVGVVLIALVVPIAVGYWRGGRGE